MNPVSRAMGVALWPALTVLALLCASPAVAATRVDLDQVWQFRPDPDEFGDFFAWQSKLPPGTESVNVPHTWNVGRLHDYMGVGWYFRNFEAPAHDAQAHVRLNFGATFYQARAWLNGVEIGSHEGGFTAYSFDITPFLHATNYLAVRIDNRPTASTIPGFGARGVPLAWYDWWTYGGVVRDVWLSTSGPSWIVRQTIRSDISAGGWQVSDRVLLHSTQPAGTAARVRVSAVDPDNRVAASTTQAIVLNGGDQEVALGLLLARPRLWSIDQPNVYRMNVELLGEADAALDFHADTFGLRKIVISERHLQINGERVRLTGIARHEDSPAEGLAESQATMRRDYDELKLLNTTLSRPVHYPQNPYILDYADRHGILLIPEIPLWQFSEAQLADPRVLALAQQQMREVIEQSANHPSILAWSVANESAMHSAAGVAYFRAMRKLIRELDPERPVSFADDNLGKLANAHQTAASEADFLMMNQYYGSWHGPSEALAPALDRVNELFPGKMVIISEMGYPGLFASNPADADPARIRVLEQQMPMLAARDWIGGAMLWCYQDYKSRRNLAPGLVEGFVEHGVVDEARHHKPSFAVWQRLNAPAHIDARWVAKAGGPASGFVVTVTANAVTELPSYPLHGYQLSWKLLDEHGDLTLTGSQALGDLRTPESVTGTVPRDAAGTKRKLIVTLLRPSGVAAAEQSFSYAQ
jgi:thiol-disulfide isomerase/thioredoxin